MTVAYPGGHDVHAYSQTYTKSPAETAGVVDDAYTAAQDNYKASQDAVAADFDMVAGVSPSISELVPSSTAAAGGTFTVEVRGVGFGPDATALILGELAVPVTWQSVNSLLIELDDISTPGDIDVTVWSNERGSNTVNFTVT